jgi:hypothetical protein
MTLRILGEATDYDGLIGACRARADELQVAGETLDVVAGFPTRYTAKLLGPRQVRRLGMFSLGPMLGALGIKLLVVEDREALTRVVDRLRKRNDNLVRGGRRKAG